jgi:hypothetical protein
VLELWETDEGWVKGGGVYGGRCDALLVGGFGGLMMMVNVAGVEERGFSIVELVEEDLVYGDVEVEGQMGLG